MHSILNVNSPLLVTIPRASVSTVTLGSSLNFNSTIDSGPGVLARLTISAPGGFINLLRNIGATRVLGNFLVRNPSRTLVDQVAIADGVSIRAHGIQFCSNCGTVDIGNGTVTLDSTSGGSSGVIDIGRFNGAGGSLVIRENGGTLYVNNRIGKPNAQLASFQVFTNGVKNASVILADRVFARNISGDAEEIRFSCANGQCGGRSTYAPSLADASRMLSPTGIVFDCGDQMIYIGPELQQNAGDILDSNARRIRIPNYFNPVNYSDPNGRIVILNDFDKAMIKAQSQYGQATVLSLPHKTFSNVETPAHNTLILQ